LRRKLEKYLPELPSVDLLKEMLDPDIQTRRSNIHARPDIGSPVRFEAKLAFLLRSKSIIPDPDKVVEKFLLNYKYNSKGRNGNFWFPKYKNMSYTEKDLDKLLYLPLSELYYYNETSLLELFKLYLEIIDHLTIEANKFFSLTVVSSLSHSSYSDSFMSDLDSISFWDADDHSKN
jgi:hypothetical protein